MSPFRMPRILRPTRAVMNAPNTGPSERLYGNWMRFSISRGTVPPPNQSTNAPGCPAAGANLEARPGPGHFGPISEVAGGVGDDEILTGGDHEHPDAGVEARRCRRHRSRRALASSSTSAPSHAKAATARARISALCSPIPPVKTMASSATERADHRSDPRDEPMDEDVDREPGALVAGVTRGDHLPQVGAHTGEAGEPRSVARARRRARRPRCRAASGGGGARGRPNRSGSPSRARPSGVKPMVVSTLRPPSTAASERPTAEVARHQPQIVGRRPSSAALRVGGVFVAQPMEAVPAQAGVEPFVRPAVRACRRRASWRGTRCRSTRPAAGRAAWPARRGCRRDRASLWSGASSVSASISATTSRRSRRVRRTSLRHGRSGARPRRRRRAGTGVVECALHRVVARLGGVRPRHRVVVTDDRELGGRRTRR